MMQRNENALLMAWMTHYASLFGARNLTVLDNGSDDPVTLRLLAHVERVGVQVDRTAAHPGDFQAKGLHFAERIREWDREGGYDFALPVDCDEFLSFVGDEGIVVDRAAILGEFARLLAYRCAFRIDTSLFNVPYRPGWFAVDPLFHKGFIPAGGVDLIDNGQHMPNSRLEDGFRVTRLTYLHWHNRPFAEMRVRAREKIGTSLIDPTDPVALRRYAEVPQAHGQHLIPVLLHDEAAYRARYDGALQVCVPGMTSPGGAALASGAPLWIKGAGRGMEGVWEWSAERYLEANPDVKAFELGPLHHFLRYGAYERRRVQPASS